jgi:uncharacterized protein YegP (UPF0339 family)
MVRHISALVALAALSLSSVACVAAPGTESDTSEAAAAETSQGAVSPSATFETFTGVDGKTYFDFVAGNGENVLRSQGYATPAAAQNGISSVLENGIDASNFEIRAASNGTSYFVLKAANGEIVATSQFYSSKAHAERGARTVRALVQLARQNLRTEPAPTRQRFELFVGEDKEVYFDLRAGNGEILLSSDAYDDKPTAVAAIAAVQARGDEASNFEVFAIDDGGYGVRLAAADGSTLVMGESYLEKSSATRAVARIAEILSGNVSTVSTVQ